ncbi:Uncharacterised protein [uncultured archaeon]|nr:Uncharacterised protein [uncultured archaeon]
MKKTLAALALGIALSTFPISKNYADNPVNLSKNLLSCSSPAVSENNSSYEEINQNKQAEELILDVFNTLNTIRQPTLVKTWNLQRELKLKLELKVDYNIQINPFKFSSVSGSVNFLFQYNL